MFKEFEKTLKELSIVESKENTLAKTFKPDGVQSLTGGGGNGGGGATGGGGNGGGGATGGGSSI